MKALLSTVQYFETGGEPEHQNVKLSFRVGENHEPTELHVQRRELRKMSPRAAKEDLNYWKADHVYILKIIAEDEINELREDMTELV